MKRETMLSSKHTATTPRTSAAETITSLAGKRNRSSNNLDLCTIDNEAFLLNDLGMPNLEASEVAARHRKACSDTKGQQQQTIVLPPLQQVGVFGVDANKRINLWNDAAAAVTGVFSPKNRCIHQHSEPEDDDSSDYGSDEDIHGRAIGMSLDDVFPSSSFEIDTGRTPPSVSTSITLADVLDRVFQTGEPSMAVPVIQKAGRKRGREEMTDESSFSVDFLPQFGFSPMVSSRMVSGVVLVCRSEKAIQRLLSREDDRSLIDIARSITMPPPLDKDRSMSAASTGTFTTETCTTGTCMTETETEVDIDKEIEAEIDNSFHTCQIDTSFRTNQIDGSFQSCQIDPSHSTPHGTKSERLEALEAFEASDNSTDGDNDELHRSLLSPPLATRKASSITDEDHRMLFETVDSIIFGVDLAGKIDAWNYRMEELTGLSRDDAMGRSLVEDTSLPLLPFNLKKPGALTFRGEVEPVLSKAYRGRSTPQFRLKVKSKTSGTAPNEESLSGQSDESRGILRHLVASVSPRYNHQKEIIGAFFLATDLTEGFMYFQSLKTDAHELRKLIDTANAPIFGINANGYINEWNDKTAEITGYSKDDAFGCLLVDTFIYPKIQESVRDILQNALQHGKGTSNYELEFKTKSNEIRHLLVNITPQHDMNNVVVGVVLIAQDVTEAVERDRAVASIALELRQLIETANAPIFGIDVHGKVNEWNTRMSTITGFAKEEAINIPLVESFIAPSMKEKVGEILDAALNGNETSNYEVEVPSKSGEPIFLLVNATTRRDADSNVVGVVGVAQDVTEDRKHAKEIRQLETLRASQEAKVETERNMTAYFAHELRNPLGAIDSALAAMPDKLPDNALSLVNGMQLCTKFMSSIMNNLLDVRKMEEGKMRLGIAPISIRDILQNVHKMLEPSIRPGVEFRKLINVKGNDWVLGDAHRIEQVLTNVISNAIKYTVTGHIQISIECEKDNVKFICEDTGPGIPKSEQAKLFQRFVQRGGCPGTGLGLAIAKHIVDLTGGSIRFESDPSVRAGTTCIVLMALPPCKAPGSSAIVKKAEFIKEPLSVLVIDDIKMNRTMVKRRILKGIAPNAKIKEAATGEEALLICAQDKFDVMIVDQFMEAAGGVMVGTDVVFAMRRMRIDSVLIGCSGNDIGTQFLDAGADMVWQKPMPSNEQIIRDLRTALDKRGIALSAQNR